MSFPEAQKHFFFFKCRLWGPSSGSALTSYVPPGKWQNLSDPVASL